MDDKTIIIVISVGIVVAAGLSAIFVSLTYDPASNNPNYCNDYARQHLEGIIAPYSINEGVAKGACTEPHWENICLGPVKDNRKCFVARSEPKFRIAFIEEI